MPRTIVPGGRCASAWSSPTAWKRPWSFASTGRSDIRCTARRFAGLRSWPRTTSRTTRTSATWSGSPRPGPSARRSGGGSSRSSRGLNGRDPDDRREEPPRHAHLRAGRPRAAREAVHEDHLSRSGGAVAMPGVDIKKDDNVRVISGKDRGKEGRVVRVLPLEGRVMVDGVALAKKHSRTGAQRTRTGQQLQQGGIIDVEMSVDISNVQLVCPSCHEPTRVGHRLNADGIKVRVCRKCDSELPDG